LQGPQYGHMHPHVDFCMRLIAMNIKIAVFTVCQNVFLVNGNKTLEECSALIYRVELL
jgi:hypothetical protein